MTAPRFPVSGLIIQSAGPDLQPGRLEVSSLKQLWNGHRCVTAMCALTYLLLPLNTAMYGVLDTPPSLIQRAKVIVSESLLGLSIDQSLDTNPIQ